MDGRPLDGNAARCDSRIPSANNNQGGIMQFISKVLLVLISAALLPACLQQIVSQDVTRIHNAENIRKTDRGRIFVSGLDAVREIIDDGKGGYAAPTVLDESCSYYGGLAQLRDWMFSVCVDVHPTIADGHLSLASGRLYARSLIDDQVVLVGELNDFSLPNGLDAIAADDVILIADEDFTLGGGVARAAIDFSSGVPQVANLQTRWIGAGQNVFSANGVRVLGRDVFLTDINSIKRVPLNDEGEPGVAQTIYQAATVFDDLVPYCDGLLVADFIRGLLVYTTLNGGAVVESPAGFTTPSAILPDATPLLDRQKMLVTLSGSTSSSGGRLIAVNPDTIGLPSCTP